MSVHPSVWLSAGLFEFFVFVLIYSMGVQRQYEFIPALGLKGPQWDPVELIYPSVSLYLCMFVRITFWLSFARPIFACSACGCRTLGQPPWVQVQYICPSVRLVVRGTFDFFVFVLIYSVGSSVAMYLSQHWGPEDPSGVQSSVYVRSIFLVLCVGFWRSFVGLLNLN